METTPSSSDAYNPTDTSGTPEFYLPGTFQFSRRAGRIERWLGRLLRDRDGARPTLDATGSTEFYLPGTPAFERRGTR